MGRKPAVTPGMRFGYLTVLSDSGERKGRYVVWVCQCDCGQEVRCSSRELLQYHVEDCGCQTKVPRTMQDLTGQRFGKLTVLYPTEQRADQGSVVWHTVCDCGKERDVSARRLTRGQVRSCGCLSDPPLKDYVGKTFGRLTVIGYAGTGRDLGLSNGKAENYWHVRCSCGKEKNVRQWELECGDTRSCGCLHNEKVRESLKLIDGTSITILENADKLRSGNSSGKTGVCFYTRSQKWAAYMTFKGKRYRLGEYKDKADAVRARTLAEEKRDKFIDWYYDEYLPGLKDEMSTERRVPTRAQPARQQIQAGG